MKRTLSILSLVLCILLFCTACSGGMTFAEYYKDTKYEDYYPTLNSMEKIGALSKLSHQQTYGEVLIFEDEEKVKFYNVDEDKIVLQVNKEKYVDCVFFDVYGYTFFAVAEGAFGFGMAMFPEDLLQQGNIDTTIKVTIYDAKGNVIESSKDKWIQACDDVEDTVTATADLIKFGSTIYRVAADGTVSAVLDNPFFGNLPDVDYYTAEYYYEISEGSVYVYDKGLNPAFAWTAPYEDAEVGHITLLAGNHLLVQYTLPLSESEDKYDVLADGDKYLLESLLIDVKSGKIKSLDLNYVLEDVELPKDALVSWDYERTENKKVDTFAVVLMIENKRLVADEKCVSINSNSGKIDFEIFTDLQGSAYMIGENCFRYTTHKGDTYLMDAQGKIISKFNGGSNASRNNAFFTINGKVYNYNLEMVYDYSKYELEVNRMMAHSILFTHENGSIKLLTTDGDAKTLPTGTTVALTRSQFFVLQTEKGYTVYAEDGNKLGTELPVLSIRLVASTTDYVILSVVTNEGTVEYYKLFAEAEESK